MSTLETITYENKLVETNGDDGSTLETESNNVTEINCNASTEIYVINVNSTTDTINNETLETENDSTTTAPTMFYRHDIVVNTSTVDTSNHSTLETEDFNKTAVLTDEPLEKLNNTYITV